MEALKAEIMWSTIVMFILTFAVLGLLLGFAEVYNAGSGGELVISPQAGSTNSTSPTESQTESSSMPAG